jgi:hypothetical protein
MGEYVYRHLILRLYGKACSVKSKVRTGLGKSDRPGSQGGYKKRESINIDCARLFSTRRRAESQMVEGIELHNVSKSRGLMLYLQQKATFYPSFKVRWIKPLWSQRPWHVTH